MAQLPADRSKLAQAQGNMSPTITASSQKLKDALTEAYDTIDTLYGFTTGLLGSNALSKLGVKIVTDFGAKGDGVTDAAAAFTSADSPGPVIVPAGTYLITDTHVLKGAHFVGAGIDKTILLFKNLGNKPAITTDESIVMEHTGFDNLTIKAASWDPVTGCTGYGIQATRKIHLRNVKVTNFKKSNIIFHHDMSGNNGPFYSSVENVYSEYSGEHGIVVGTGANTVVVINPVCRWNGCPSYGVQPSALGNYDGLIITSGADGNPGGSYPQYDPEGVVLLGGDCSYNSRYGWNFDNPRQSFLMTDYSELNQNSNQIRLGAACRANFIRFAMGSSNDFLVSETNATVNPNSVYIGGACYGSGGKDVSGNFYNIMNRNLRTALSAGSNCDIYFDAGSDGNVSFRGGGFQPTIFFRQFLTFVDSLRLGSKHVPVAASAVASTHKIPIDINGTTYYLLASSS